MSSRTGWGSRGTQEVAAMSKLVPLMAKLASILTLGAILATVLAGGVIGPKAPACRRWRRASPSASAPQAS